MNIMNVSQRTRSCAGLLLLVLPAGCGSPEIDHNCRHPVCGHTSFAVSPTVDIPLPLREQNWGTGSCVHASTVHLLRWQGQYEMADWWRAAYFGGEYPERLHERLDAAGLRYAFTTSGDGEFLEWALRTRRGAGITFWPQHAVNLVHLDQQQASLLDNNRVDQVIWIPRDEFLQRWKSYGGWAWTLVYDPSPPTPYFTGDVR